MTVSVCDERTVGDGVLLMFIVKNDNAYQAGNVIGRICCFNREDKLHTVWGQQFPMDFSFH